MAKKPLSGKGCRRKGHGFERLVAKVLRSRACTYPSASRGNQSNPNVTVPDVDGTPFWIECKRTKISPKIQAALVQASNDAKAANDTRPPLAITKQDGKPIVVSMYMPTFIEMLNTPEKFISCGKR